MNGSRKRPLFFLLTFVALAMAFFVVATPAVKADSPSTAVYPPGSQPLGMTYSEWSEAWWTWAQSLDPNGHPNTQQGAVDCSAHQPAGDVWFLAGNFGGATERSCTIPDDKALLFPIVNVVAWSPGDFETEHEGRQLLKMIMRTTHSLEVTLDGEPLNGPQRFRAQSPIWTQTLPEPNIWGLGPPYTYDFISDGYWVMLEPLPAGEHTLNFKGGIGFFGDFMLDITYHFTVTE